MNNTWPAHRRHCCVLNVTFWQLGNSPNSGNRLQLCSMSVWKVKVWTLVIAPLTWVRLATSSTLQAQKWQLTGMSQWCRRALCGHPLPALTDNWTLGAASRHTTAPISYTRPLLRSPQYVSYYSFLVPLRVGGWVGLSTQWVSNLLKVAQVKPATSWLRVRYSTTTSLHPLTTSMLNDFVTVIVRLQTIWHLTIINIIKSRSNLSCLLLTFR